MFSFVSDGFARMARDEIHLLNPRMYTRTHPGCSISAQLGIDTVACMPIMGMACHYCCFKCTEIADKIRFWDGLLRVHCVSRQNFKTKTISGSQFSYIVCCTDWKQHTTCFCMTCIMCSGSRPWWNLYPRPTQASAPPSLRHRPTTLAMQLHL